MVAVHVQGDRIQEHAVVRVGSEGGLGVHVEVAVVLLRLGVFRERDRGRTTLLGLRLRLGPGALANFNYEPEVGILAVAFEDKFACSCVAGSSLAFVGFPACWCPIGQRSQESTPTRLFDTLPY